MKRLVFALTISTGVVLTAAAADPVLAWDGHELPRIRIAADRMAADNITGSAVATGHVTAVAEPFRVFSELAVKDGPDYRFADPTAVTTCTNAEDHLHWLGSGEIVYRDGHAVIAKDMVLRLWDIPVLWLPYWYYPLDTDYGLRVMPGYTSRWGAHLLTKYVYPIAGGFGPGEWGVSGSTRFDWREENGVALGQGLRWQLGDFGRGHLKAYYAWDNDADRYDRHWTTRKRWHYENWGSDVPDERYAVQLEHRWEASERDTVRMKGTVVSDTHFRSDFLRDGHFGQSNRFLGYEGNELAWEHVENPLGFGVSVSGPLNDFYDGVARLPEVYLDLAPQPLFGLGVNYESQTRAGFLNRDYARYGTRKTAVPFRYGPGEWADYQAFRLDTYHRFTCPFKVRDVVSIVPRVGVRGTFWSDSGRENLSGLGRARTTGDDVWRTIVEGGVTFNARGVAELESGRQHIVEPYLDVLAQEAQYAGLSHGSRPLVFDAIDTSSDWLDQFAGRSRNLPYSWYGVTPGVRNALRAPDAKGRLRTLLDVDLYAAVQFNDTSWSEGGRYHRLARHASDPNWGRHAGQVMPGVRARWFPSEDTVLLARVEFDTEREEVAYADVSWRQELSKTFKYGVTYSGRDHRWWDFSSSPYDRDDLRNEDFNWAKFSYLEVELEQDVCDALAWGPFVRWDCRESELDEIGAWVDLRTDCLGFRFSVSYENDYERLDRSESEDDWRFGFFVYLRAFGPSTGSPF